MSAHRTLSRASSHTLRPISWLAAVVLLGVAVLASLTFWSTRSIAQEQQISDDETALSAERLAAGREVFAARCTECHGDDGAGSIDYPKRLGGDRSLAQLNDFVGKTMPEDDPGTLTKDELEEVTAFLYDKFYSPLARAAEAPPRVELSRLTVGQFRNSVTDLLASFGDSAERWDDERGLAAQYYKGRRLSNNERVLERIDAQVNMDFGGESPVPGEIEPHEFSIRWFGSVLAPETGEYEFIIHTEHAARLWVNDLDAELIDAWVKSGDDTEYRGSIYLLAGRIYPLRLEYTKAKQGVDDSDKLTDPQPEVHSTIALEWIPPGRPREVVPGRRLSPKSATRTFAVSAAFPPDDRSYGWVRGATVSKDWDAAVTSAAIETATDVDERINALADTRDDARDREEKIRRFCHTLAERAFRRPLSEEQKSLYIDRHFEGDYDEEIAIKSVVLMVLKSPRFLYLNPRGERDDYSVAESLSFGLWDSTPDRELLQAAEKGELKSPQQIVEQAQRMLGDPRARAKLHQFLLTWLKVDQTGEIAKDNELFPGFDAEVAADLRTSLELFLDDVAWDDEADFRRLFLSRDLYLNERLAKIYPDDLRREEDQESMESQIGFSKVRADSDVRHGVVTHPYVMSLLAYRDESSPIHRGVQMARGILGVSLRPPPDAFTPLAAEEHPELSHRQRIELQTEPAMCAGCHSIINPLGFTLGNFDAIGRYREEENGLAIDSSGGYKTRAGAAKEFKNSRDLAEFLAGSDEVQENFVRQMFQFYIRQPVQAYEGALPVLLQSFTENDFHIRKLVVAVVATAAMAKPEQEAVSVEDAQTDDRPDEENNERDRRAERRRGRSRDRD